MHKGLGIYKRLKRNHCKMKNKVRKKIKWVNCKENG